MKGLGRVYKLYITTSVMAKCPYVHIGQISRHGEIFGGMKMTETEGRPDVRVVFQLRL